MTMSSQMQLLTSNPVPLIGTRFLTNFSNNSNTSNNNDISSVNANIGGINGRLRQCLVNKINCSSPNPKQPPKRCLFGKAESSDIEKLIAEQNEQNRKHLLNEYNFDIYEPNYNNNNNNNNHVQISKIDTENIYDNCNSDNNCKKELNLIELELRDYNNRLDADESNIKTNQKRRDEFKCNSIKNISLLDKDTKCNQQRKKPYKRQTSLTEFYRQTSTCGSSIRAIRVTELPRSQRAKLLILKQEEEQQERLQNNQENQHKSTPSPHFDNA